MKAVVCPKYGPPEVLHLTEMGRPVPKANEVLIRVRATTVHIGDTKIRALRPGMGPWLDLVVKAFMRIAVGFTGPRRKILGMELSGEIEETGRDVTAFKKGDLVFCGTEMLFGAYAEYICLPQAMALVKKPANMSHEEAATVPNGGITALLMLRKAGVGKGQKVLIYGASGSVGTFAVQLARNFGAEVTGVCSAANLEMVRSLGAEKVIDYTASDFRCNGERYDVIFDAVGKLSRSSVKCSLTRTGRYFNVLTDSGTSMKLHVADLTFLKEQIEAGKLRTVIDRTYSLEEIVEAHRYVDLGHKKGNVAVTVGQGT
ncbi:MAG: NAD(P)-dependent alcohol dehydrogenase [Deltaproteobacteria bacterium]|nr:NAD(P)-dependent alcohol dehydrogenase [Deltaproteobacteria bacterium]